MRSWFEFHFSNGSASRARVELCGPSPSHFSSDNVRRHTTRARTRAMGFLRLEDFLLQNCAIQRKAARTNLLGTASEKQTAQQSAPARARRCGLFSVKPKLD